MSNIASPVWGLVISREPNPRLPVPYANKALISAVVIAVISANCVSV